MVIVAADYESARKKGVEHLFLQHDEGGFFEKVILVSPYLRRDRVIALGGGHEFRESGLGTGVVQRLLAPLHIVRLVLACVRTVRAEHIDVIRATEPTLCGLVAWATARLAGVPYVLSLHADYDKRFELDGRRGAPTLFGFRAPIRPLERLTLRGATRVLPIRESLVPYALARGVSRENIRVVPHGVNFAALERSPAVDVRTRFRIPVDKAILAFAGRLSAENYVGDMLDAIQRLAGRRNDFVLVLAGGGVLEGEIAARLRDDPTLARVVLPVGFVSQETVYALRQACAVSICLMGGFSLIEACAAGRPVVVYDVEWHRELVIDGETGRVLPEHDVAAVTEAIAALLDDPGVADRMGAAARTRAAARHGLPDTQAVKRRVYADVLKASSGGSA